jgi:hypothetical protein
MTPRDGLIKQRQCVGKLKFTEPEARREAKKMHKKVKLRYSAYLCPWCAAWHIGGQRSKEAARRRRPDAPLVPLP